MSNQSNDIHEITDAIQAISTVLYNDLVNSECEETNLLTNKTKGGLFSALSHLASNINGLIDRDMSCETKIKAVN